MKKVNIFLSYSHKNSQGFDEVRETLQSIEGDIGIELWDDTKIKVGDKWKNEIETALKKADIGILLVTRSFLTSSFIKDVEVKQLLSQYNKNGKTKIFIVILRQCAWKKTKWLSEFQLFNNGIPLWNRDVNKRDGYLVKLTEDLDVMVKGIRKKSSSHHSAHSPKKNLDQENVELPFTNQASSIKVLKPPENTKQSTFTYATLTGPAGQGKTRLLCKLKDLYKEKGWSCGYAVFDPEKGEKILVKDLLNDLGVAFKDVRGNKKLGKEFYNQYTERKKGWKKPLALFIDTLGNTTKNDVLILENNFVEDLDKYITTNEYFSEVGRYRLFFAGRNLSSDLIDSQRPEKYTVDIKLSPFRYEDVHDMVKNYGVFSHLKPDTKADFAADILYLSGGHPGLMASIVNNYKREKLSHQEFIGYYIECCWGNDLTKTMNEVSRGVFSQRKKIKEFAEATVAFRYFNKSILKKMFRGQAVEKIVSEVINYSGIYRESDNPEYTTLFSDGTIRDLHALHMIARNPENIKSKCLEAQELCWDEIISGFKVKEFMIEYLFQCLQESIAESKNKIHSQRKVIRRNYEKKAEKFVAKLAKIYRDSIRKEDLGKEFISVLRRQADTKDDDKNKALFRFWIIYIYKDKSYNTDIYTNVVISTEKLVNKYFGRRKK
jgi:hypothetical protein